MVRQLLLILLISHIIADFAVRREVLGQKNGARTSASWPHLLVFVGLNSLAFLCIAFLNGSISAVPWMAYSRLVLGVALFHWLVDRVFQRTGLWDREKVGSRQRWLYVIQQALKIVFILLAAGAGGTVSFPGDGIKPLAYVFGYAFSLFAGDAFVCLVLTKLTWTTDKEAVSESVAGGGRLIGVFEAILVTTFVIAHQYAAIGVILAAKSLARFEWLKDHEGRAEYFLVGTLANLTWLALGGLLALWFAGRALFPG